MPHFPQTGFRNTDPFLIKSSVNMKIMGFALWEGLKFWGHRRSRNYKAEKI